MTRNAPLFITLLTLASPAWAQLGASKDNSSKPIDITSDTLEVDQTQQVAVFTGNVVAIQGEMNLHSDRMVVYYTKKDGTAPGAPAPASNAAPPQSAISKIVVEGHVVLATPEESAQGKHGIYQMDQKTMHLSEDVIVTRGKNVLRGTKLDYNLENGRSVLVGAGGAEVPSSNGGRVHGLFMPDEKKPAAAPDAKAKPAPATPAK